jgi:hypothetical protein
LRAAYPLQDAGAVLRILPLPLLAASGCFLYLDPIVQRPSIDILPQSSTPVYRGDTVAFDAIGTDPQHKAIAFTWQIFACVDGLLQSSCEMSPFYTGTDATAKFTVPVQLVGTSVAVQSLRIQVSARDTAGATTSGDQILVVPVGDRPPIVELRADSRHGFVVNAPMAVYAKIGDSVSQELPLITLAWNVFNPPGILFALDDLAVPQDPNDPMHVQYGKTFTPKGIGAWTIQVVATDSLATSATIMQQITVSPDHPPCLAQLTPIVPPNGDTLPITDPTLFVVDTVTDDLDPYPPTPQDPVTGVTEFQWSLMPPGGNDHVPLDGANTNRMSIDPSTYNPGDIVELRVEIFDRNTTMLPCPDASESCSILNETTCLQRQTWRLEIR